MPTCFAVLETRSQLIISLPQVILPKNHPLLAICSEGMSKLPISTHMEPEEAMMKSWQGEHSQTQESSTLWLQKLALKQLTFHQDKCWTSVMLHSDTSKKGIQLSFWQEQSTDLVHQEIGLPKGLISSALKLSLLNPLKESIAATLSEWESFLSNLLVEVELLN